MASWISFSEAGGHPDNEDAFLVERHPTDPDCILCFLADGQGGRAGGAEAARTACHAARDAALLCHPTKLLSPEAWPTLLAEADRAVATNPVAGFTTLVGFACYQKRVVGASCGDSAAALLGEERVRDLTSGQVKNPPVGSGNAWFVSFAAALPDAGRVLALSDGVWKYAGWDRIRQNATLSGSDLLEVLTRAARLPGSGRFSDDFTLVIVETTA